MTIPLEKERLAVIAHARRMSSAELSPGRSGNVSMRAEGGFLITPTGMEYDELAPRDVPLVALDGRVLDGPRLPSSEWHFHAAIYGTFQQANAVVHAHSRYATALACLRRPIPAFHYMVAVAGGRTIPLADYATFGTEALANHVVHALAGHKACLLANHGQVAVGASIGAALDLAFEIEALASQYVAAASIGEPHVLDDDEMDRVIEKFKTYGQQSSRE